MKTESKKMGRPPVPDDKKLVRKTLRLTESQWEKLLKNPKNHEKLRQFIDSL